MEQRNKEIEEHYRENAENLIRFMAFKHQGNIMDGEDIVHDAYARAVRYYNTYNPRDSTFSKWFNKILANTERDFIRVSRKHGMAEDIDEIYLEPVPDVVEGVQDVEGLYKLISRQSSANCEILLLYYRYQYSLGDIAALIKTSNYKQIDNIIKHFRTIAIREKKI